MEPHIPIENLLRLTGATAEARQSVLESFVAALAEISNVNSVRTGQSEGEAWVRFYSEWEPPFKALKKASGVQAEVTCVLLSEAFAKSHWLSRAEYLAGKGKELTVSRVDDEFDVIFFEIFGKDLPAWEAAQSAPFPAHA